MCECRTPNETGTLNGFMCGWHRDKYLAAIEAERLLATPPPSAARPASAEAPQEAVALLIKRARRVSEWSKAVAWEDAQVSDAKTAEIFDDLDRALDALTHASPRELKAQPAVQGDVSPNVLPGSVASGGAGRTDAIPPSAARPASAGALTCSKCNDPAEPGWPTLCLRHWNERLLGEIKSTIAERERAYADCAASRATAEAVREACAKVADEAMRRNARLVDEHVATPDATYIDARAKGEVVATFAHITHEALDIAAAIRALDLTRLPAEGEN